MDACGGVRNINMRHRGDENASCEKRTGQGKNKRNMRCRRGGDMACLHRSESTRRKIRI